MLHVLVQNSKNLNVVVAVLMWLLFLVPKNSTIQFVEAEATHSMFDVQICKYCKYCKYNEYEYMEHFVTDENEHYEMAHFSTKTTPEKSKRPEPPNVLFKEPTDPGEQQMKHPWQTLVSYVDDLTVGGRKNSQGQYTDPKGNFTDFGKPKEPKTPQDCFPGQCYDLYV